LEYIFHVKTTIDHFGKKMENVSEPKLDHTVNLGHTQHPSQSLAENRRKGSFCYRYIVDKMEGYQEGD